MIFGPNTRLIPLGFLYILKMVPSLWTNRLILPDSCSSSFRKCPTCSEYATSQKTQISARSRWMLALHVGSLEELTDRFRAHQVSSMSLQLHSEITHLALWRRWSLWTDTAWWKRLDGVSELCSRTPLCVNTLQERLSGCGRFLGDAASLRRWFGVSDMQNASLCLSGISAWMMRFSVTRQSAASCSSSSVTGFVTASRSSVPLMTGAGLAGLMGSRPSDAAVRNHGVKTGGARQGKGSRSFSALSNRELNSSADPG